MKVPQLHGVYPEAIITQITRIEGIIGTSSTYYELEAFSHNLTHDSFKALAVQPTSLPTI